MAITTIIEAIRVVGPQFISNPMLDDYIEIAKLNTSTQCFGAVTGVKYMYAVALRVCHMLALDVRNGGLNDGNDSGDSNPGMIRSEKEGQLEKTYTQSNNDSNFGYLNLTTYGKQLIELIKGNCVLPITRLVC